MMHWKSSAALLLAAQLAGAWNPATDQAICNEERRPCLTSFVFCSNTRDEVDGCYFPEYTYPWFNRDFGSNPAAVLDSHTYNLTWQNFNPDYPVLVTLSFGRADTTYDDYIGYGNWSRNFTDTTFFELNFADIIREFPTPTSNLTAAAVYGLLGTEMASFRLSQPDIPLNSSDNTWPLGAFSDGFYVFDGSARIFLETQRDLGREAENKKWSRAVGIGVGVGVPFLLAGAFLGGWLFGKRKGKKTPVADAKLSTSS